MQQGGIITRILASRMQQIFEPREKFSTEVMQITQFMQNQYVTHAISGEVLTPKTQKPRTLCHPGGEVFDLKFHEVEVWQWCESLGVLLAEKYVAAERHIEY